MNRDDIIRWAREASGTNDIALISYGDLHHFACLVAAHAHVEPCCQKFDVCQKVCMPRAAAAERAKFFGPIGWMDPMDQRIRHNFNFHLTITPRTCAPEIEVYLRVPEGTK